MSGSVFVRLFAGVPQDYFGTVPLVPFGQWLLPVGIFLLLAGVRVEMGRKMGTFSVYRHGTVLKWWKIHFGKGLLYSAKTTLLLMTAALACDTVMGNVHLLCVALVVQIGVMWLFHGVSMAAWLIFLDLFSVGRFVLGALLVFEGVTFIIGSRVRAVSAVMYGMWGMYLQSSLCETGGFPAGAVLAAELVLTAAAFFTGWEYLKRSILAVENNDRSV